MGADFCREELISQRDCGSHTPRPLILCIKFLQQKTKNAPSPLYSLVSSNLVL